VKLKLHSHFRQCAPIQGYRPLIEEHKEAKVGELCSRDKDKAIKKESGGDARTQERLLMDPSSKGDQLNFFDLSFSGDVWLARDVRSCTLNSETTRGRQTLSPDWDLKCRHGTTLLLDPLKSGSLPTATVRLLASSHQELAHLHIRDIQDISRRASLLRKTNFSPSDSLAMTGRTSNWDSHLHNYSNGSRSSVNCASCMTEACRMVRFADCTLPDPWGCNEARISRCII
jgi:hypothetical protein